MIREVNLISHLPLYVQNYREIQGIMNAENPEMQSIEDASEKIKDNLFVQYCDEQTIERYEKMVGLSPLVYSSLESRQATVLAQYTNVVTYTLRGLIDILNVICGPENYTLELIPDEYTINVGVDLRYKFLVDVLKSMSINMIPANMILNCVVNYNKYKVLANYPTYLLMQFTHQELRDELIENNISTTCENIANYTVESLESIECELLSTYGMRKV